MSFSLLAKFGWLLGAWLGLWGGALLGVWGGMLVVLGLAAFGGVLLFQGVMFGGVFIGLALVTFGLGFRNIPANPPHKGLVTIWGKRQSRVLGEGYRVIAPYFPFFYDLIFINIEQKNQGNYSGRPNRKTGIYAGSGTKGFPSRACRIAAKNVVPFFRAVDR